MATEVQLVGYDAELAGRGAGLGVDGGRSLFRSEVRHDQGPSVHAGWDMSPGRRRQFRGK